MTGDGDRAGPAQRRTRRWKVGLILGTTVLIVAAAAFWAGWQVRRPTVATVDAPQTVTYRAAVGTLGRTAPASVTVSWTVTATVTLPFGGTITATPASGTVTDGGVLLRVDDRAVVAVIADTPFFRALTPGLSGPDVAAFLAFLHRKGFLASPPGVTLDPGAVAAVRTWQASVGAEATGSVDHGLLQAVRTADTMIRPDVRWGDTIAPGSPVAHLLAAAPTFVAQVDAGSPGGALSGRAVIIKGPTQWSATLGAAQAGEGGSIRYLVDATGPGAICGSSCAEIPLDAPTVYPATVQVVPERSGILVPTSALHTTPDGTVFVLDAGARRVDVTLVASDGGMALVAGLVAGAIVLLPTKVTGPPS